jgi:hypothetical protein
MLLQAVEQDARWVDERTEFPNLFDGSVNALVSASIHVRRCEARGARDALTAMKEDSTPADVFAESIHDGVKLTDGYRLLILDGHMKVVDAPVLRFDGNFGQGYDRSDAMGIASREFLGVSKATNEKAFPYLGGSPRYMSFSHNVH